VLKAAGVTLGKTYPHPLVSHAEARAAALAGYQAVKAATASA
jgi:deoxyribodipyrimidine photo-lyase